MINITTLLNRLKKHYGNATCALNHKSAFELLAATILSAQCTDERVNKVTPALFKRFPTPAALAKASQDEVEALVRTTGFFRNKAKSLIGMAQMLTEQHDGVVPRTMEELIKLPGVARKTANVVLGTWYEVAVGVVVDTHVMRLSKRLGLTKSEEPKQIERELMKIIPKKRWISFAHQLIHHGRALCVARRPKCDQCFLADVCPSAFKG
jgi:endonuclease III